MTKLFILFILIGSSTITLQAFPSTEEVLDEMNEAIKEVSLFSDTTEGTTSAVSTLQTTHVAGPGVPLNSASFNRSEATANVGLSSSIVSSGEISPEMVEEPQEEDTQRLSRLLYSAVAYKVASETLSGIKICDMAGTTAPPGQGLLGPEATAVWCGNTPGVDGMIERYMVLNNGPTPVPLYLPTKDANDSFNKVIPTIVPMEIEIKDRNEVSYQSRTQPPTDKENEIIRMLIKAACERHYGEEVVKAVLSDIDAPKQVHKPVTLQYCADILRDIHAYMEEHKTPQNDEGNQQASSQDAKYLFLSDAVAQKIVQSPYFSEGTYQAQLEQNKKDFDEVAVSAQQAMWQYYWLLGEASLREVTPYLAGAATAVAARAITKVPDFLYSEESYDKRLFSSVANCVVATALALFDHHLKIRNQRLGFIASNVLLGIVTPRMIFNREQGFKGTTFVDTGIAALVGAILTKKCLSSNVAWEKANKACSIWTGKRAKEVLASFQQEQEKDEKTIVGLEQDLKDLENSSEDESNHDLNKKEAIELLYENIVKVVQERADLINQLIQIIREKETIEVKHKEE